MGAFITSVDSNAASEITGSGTANTIAMFTAAQEIGNSVITQGIGGVAIDISPSAASSGNVTAFNITQAANTGQSATTEINGTKFFGTSRQWATGAITTQREHYWSTTTYTAVGASTITNAYGAYFEAPTASTNVTITNNWAIGANNNVLISFNQNARTQLRVVNTTNGSSAAASVEFYNNSSNALIALSSGSNTVLSGSLALNFENFDSGGFTFRSGTATSGVRNFISYTPSSNTNQTLSTEVSGYLYNSYSRQWATGAITTQREQYLKTVTYAFVGASTITNAYGLYVESATAGTNATITNNYAAGFSGSAGIQIASGTIALAGIVIREAVGIAAEGAIYMGVTPSSTNYCFRALANYTTINYGTIGGFYITSGGNTRVLFENSSVAFTPALTTATATTSFTFTNPANTNQTLSTEIPGFKFVGGSRQWATGAITTQRETYFSTTTYTAVGASVITNAYGLYVEAPTASTNVTITNNYAIGTNGSIIGNVIRASGAAGFVSSDGSAGITGTFNILTSSTVSFKDGIVTALT